MGMAPGRSGKSFAEHSQLVDAIAAGDRGKAEEAMNLHLTHVLEVLQEIAAEETVAI